MDISLRARKRRISMAEKRDNVAVKYKDNVLCASQKKHDKDSGFTFCDILQWSGKMD